MSLAADVLAKYRARGWRLATAESCTGGLVAAALTEVPGSSDVFERGYVTYSNQSKIDMLGVAQKTLEAHGAVSEQVAAEMARAALELASVDMAVSVTGIAGPGGSAFKPEGMVCFGLAVKGQDVQSRTVQFGALGRAQVRDKSVRCALQALRRADLLYSGAKSEDGVS